MAEFMAVWTIVLVALFISGTLADWPVHEARVELLPNDIVPQHLEPEPLPSVIISPQKVIEGQVASLADCLRQSIEEVRQSMNPKGKRNVGGTLPPFIQVLMLFFTLVSKLNQINSLAHGQGMPKPSLDVANGLTGAVPPGATHIVHSTAGNPANLGNKLGLAQNVVQSPTILQNSIGHSNAVQGINPGMATGILPLAPSSNDLPVEASVKEIGSKGPPVLLAAAPTVVADKASVLPVGSPKSGLVPTGALTNAPAPAPIASHGLF